MTEIIPCEILVSGHGSGIVLASSQTISFWGGVDPDTGKITDPRHELFGESIREKILVFPYGKGSAAAPLVLLELARQKTGPAAIINVETDPLLVAGPIISKHFYGRNIPVVKMAPNSFELLRTGQFCYVDGEQGKVMINRACVRSEVVTLG